ncbi:MAG: DUF2339 domain-containing protein [Betaproteobacteria bacterium HGW-Betaproteobacteria-22]|nr:MAG: DUF2339 domain-containing protein [Betaproteobacteria bacterium HGW-Betaproteobacteria-22]
MESLLLLLGLLGIASIIGGVSAFFALFSSQNKESRLKALERETTQQHLEITKLAARLDALKKLLEPSQSEEGSCDTVATTIKAPTAVVDPASSIQETHQPDIAYDDRQDAAEIAGVPAIGPEHASGDTITAEIPDTGDPVKPVIKLAEPNFIERGFAAAGNWLLGGNTLVRSGIVILFIGISFLIKYAAEHTHVPIELRLAGIALLGVGLLTLGWQLRFKRAQYAWALQGGGIGVIYLTIFAALKLYQLIPAGAAFGILIAVAVLSALIAVLQSAMPLAILGFAGGFLAPILTSSGGGNHVGLFSYYLVLNLGIALIAYHKSWRPLNVLGFAFTFIIGTLWGATSYTPAHFSSTEPFLVIHFLLFTAIAVLYAHRQATKASDYVDATLVFGTPIVGFSLQYALLRDTPFGLAYSALALGVFYVSLAWWVYTRKRDTLKFLGECFLALGVGFTTLTLPLALDGRWTSAAWAIEGVGLLWVGLRQNRALPAFAGLALQLLAAIAFSKGWDLAGHTDAGHHHMFLGVAFIALSSWACGALLNHYHENKLNIFNFPLALWGWVWWIGASLTAIDAFLPPSVFAHAGLAFAALTSLLLPVAAKYLKWPRLSHLSVLLLPILLIAAFHEMSAPLTLYGHNRHPFAEYGYLAWPLALFAYAWLMHGNIIARKTWLRAPWLWIVTWIAIFEWQYRLGQFVYEAEVWRQVGWAIVPALIVGAVIRWQLANKTTLDATETFNAHTWAWLASLPLMVFLIAWFFDMTLHANGYAAPLAYLPLINPLDIALMAVLLLLVIWQRAISKHLGHLQNINPALAGIMSFALLNGVLLRTLHHWVGTPFQWTSLLTDSTVQMSFTFLWGLVAFILMLLAHQRKHRQLWLVGASLIGITVAKIFLLDMAQTGSVERIVSFIGAGMMLLVMGYFAPLPPVAEQKQAPMVPDEAST